MRRDKIKEMNELGKRLALNVQRIQIEIENTPEIPGEILHTFLKSWLDHLFILGNLKCLATGFNILSTNYE